MSRYQAYPEYKDSGVEWLERIPSDWMSVAIKYMALEPTSLFLDGDWIESKDISDDGIKYITTGNVGEGVYKEQGTGFISSEKFIELNCTEVFPGDILVSRLNNPIGRACQLPDFGGRVVTSVDNVIFRPDQVYLRAYLVYLFSSSEYFEHTTNLARGATMQRISRGLLGNIRVVTPSKREQEKIAAFLDHETAKIDALIEKQQWLIELLKEKRQAVISHAVTKGLNPNAPMKDSGVEWLGVVPAHWMVGKCGFHISILPGYAFQSSGFSDNDEDTKLLRGINVGVNSLKWDEVVYWKRRPSDGLDTYVMQDGDIVIGMDRPLISEGIRVAKVKESDLPCLLLQRVASIKVNRDLDADYLLMLLSSDMFAAHFKPDTTGVSVPHISPDQIGNFVIPIPTVEEQKQIVFFGSSESHKLLELIYKAEEAISLMQERRTALISAAVTGKIDVRDWQAGFEDSIRAEAVEAGAGDFACPDAVAACFAKQGA